MAHLMMWIDQQEDGVFHVVHRKLGVLARTDDFGSAVYFFNRWNKEHEITDVDIVEDLNARTERQSI